MRQVCSSLAISSSTVWRDYAFHHATLRDCLQTLRPHFFCLSSQSISFFEHKPRKNDPPGRRVVATIFRQDGARDWQGGGRVLPRLINRLHRSPDVHYLTPDTIVDKPHTTAHPLHLTNPPPCRTPDTPALATRPPHSDSHQRRCRTRMRIA